MVMEEVPDGQREGRRDRVADEGGEMGGKEVACRRVSRSASAFAHDGRSGRTLKSGSEEDDTMRRRARTRMR